MLLSELSFIELNNIIDLSTFDCNDADLNDFLKNDALNYQNELMSKTYLFTDNQEIIAFFSVSNDNLVDKGYTNNSWNRLHRKTDIPNPKRIKQYPAVKIGRLGVNCNHQGNGLGCQLLDFVKGWVVEYSKTGCRFILVDAYNKPEVIKFYEKNKFTLLLDTDSDDNTRIMYFDLMRFK